MANSGSGGVYTPLKQIVTDSDSDEESLKHNEHSPNPKIAENGSININSGLQSSKSNNNFSTSDNDDQNTYLNTMETTMDNVSFLQADEPGKMSIMRIILFVFSILFCIFALVIFLWIVPCAEPGVCQGKVWLDKTTSWEVPYENIELKGAINVVDGATPNSKNLIFLYRGNIMQQKQATEVTNGVLLVVGVSGKVGWYTRESRLPTDIDCKLLDADNDGNYDCILTGSEGLLATLNPLTGTFHWYLSQHGASNNMILTVDFPVILKDVDGDHINDLLTSCSYSPSANHNTLVMISGANGNIIGLPLTVVDCNSIHKLSIDKSFMISFTCKNNTSSSESLKLIGFAELYRRITKRRFVDIEAKWRVLNQHVVPESRKQAQNQSNTYVTENGKLVIENWGKCPDNCRANLKLIVEKNGTRGVFWEYGPNHVHAMAPAAFSFANSIHGFVVKL